MYASPPPPRFPRVHPPQGTMTFLLVCRFSTAMLLLTILMMTIIMMMVRRQERRYSRLFSGDYFGLLDTAKISLTCFAFSGREVKSIHQRYETGHLSCELHVVVTTTRSIYIFLKSFNLKNAEYHMWEGALPRPKSKRWTVRWKR